MGANEYSPLLPRVVSSFQDPLYCLLYFRMRVRVRRGEAEREREIVGANEDTVCANIQWVRLTGV